MNILNTPTGADSEMKSAEMWAERTEGYIDGATTRLCIPAKNSAMSVIQLMVKKGWFQRDEKKETCRETKNITTLQNDDVCFLLI